ncbi:MAG: nitrate reductase subunit beta [Propionibacteriaceae bacterium]|jgi:nitrate reductase beta subunit|nr:nitrate reductase subunit beta [Propionibacteriaceae bacterium]
MKILAQVAMVMNLDKCIGCNTCSVTCKQTWTNRDGIEYAWFNNVESKPGIGFPKAWEDQSQWRGGWKLDAHGRLTLVAGSKLGRFLGLPAPRHLPGLEDYGEPTTYDWDTLLSAPAGTDMPVARPLDALSGQPRPITWGVNWEDSLAGSPQFANLDPNLRAISQQVSEAIDQTFLFHLPRICNHCLNPACVASCPSGAMFKRQADGIVLVDQNACRGWRLCVKGCPYKKTYINHRSGKAEKCTFCFPRIEEGLPTVCAETCSGRMRYIGLVLYDLDRVEAAASIRDPKQLLAAQRLVFADPNDPEVVANALANGVAEDWLEAARRSPVWALINRFQVALPLHPEFRTLPMVWYIPPLSPVLDATAAFGGDNTEADDVARTVAQLRIPMEYLAQLFTGGDVSAVAGVLMKLSAMRTHMRNVTVKHEVDEPLLAAVKTTAADLEALYRLLAIAKPADRFVIPLAHNEDARRLAGWQSGCALDQAGGPGMSHRPTMAVSS